MRTLVVSERLSKGSDDGIKNIALAFLRELRARGHDVLGLSEWADLPAENVQRFRANRFYLSSSLAARVRRFGPDHIVYVPWTSATARGLFRLAALRAYAGGAVTALVATQPMPLGRLGRRAARLLRPDLVFVQCDETRRILQQAGCETAFLPSGYAQPRFRPGAPGERPALRAELGLDPDRPLLVHVGHLKRERISADLVRTIRDSHPGLQILMVGSPHTPQEEDLAGELLALGVRLIREFVENISRVYRAADVYLFPVRNRFACVGVPLSVIEAMASGLPVVSTPFGGLPDLFRGAEGVFFGGDDREIARCVTQALQRPAWETSTHVRAFGWPEIVGDAMALLSAGPDRGMWRARFLASLLPDGPAGTAPAAGMSPAEVREDLRRNKLPLMSLHPDAARHLPRGALERAAAMLQEARSEYDACRQVWEERGIRTLFTKSAGPFPYESDNMDLLVDPQRTEEAKRALHALSYHEMRQYREDWKAISKRLEGPRLRNIVHFHEEVSWGVEPFLDRESLWRRARRSPDDPSIEVLSREDAFLTVTAHAVYENDRIKLGDVWKVRRLVAGPGFDWSYCRDTARSIGWEPGYDLILLLFSRLEEQVWGSASIPPPQVEEARRRLAGTGTGRFARRVLARPPTFPLPLSLLRTKLLFFRKVLANPRSGAVVKLRRLGGAVRDNVEALLRINHQRPFLVSFSGIDGSGKSSLVEALCAALDAAEIRHRVVWMRGGNSALLRVANQAFRRLLGRRVERIVQPSAAGPREEARIVSPLLGAVWLWIVAAEQSLLYLGKVTASLAARRVVILDRGLVDTLVDLRIRFADPAVERRLPLALLARVAPSPDLAWHLKVDPSLAHRRKADDFTPETLERRAAQYDAVAAAHGLESIRTDDEPEATARRVVARTLGAYFERFPRSRPRGGSRPALRAEDGGN